MIKLRFAAKSSDLQKAELLGQNLTNIDWERVAVRAVDGPQGHEACVVLVDLTRPAGRESVGVLGTFIYAGSLSNLP